MAKRVYEGMRVGPSLPKKMLLSMTDEMSGKLTEIAEDLDVTRASVARIALWHFLRSSQKHRSEVLSKYMKKFTGGE